jgi:hypothetical protein
MKIWVSIKRIIKKTPIIGAGWVHLRERRARFRSTSGYWDRRYKSGGNSGPGSYNRLAQFKAEFLNRFVEEYQVTSVVEYGCGDGAQLGLARYPDYTGVDISATAVKMCRDRFAGDSSKRFLQLDATTQYPIVDLSLSLDVVFHLVEDAVFEAYMRRLFESARRFVIIYSSNEDQEWTGQHVRHRQFTRWIEENRRDWHLHFTLKNAYPYDPGDPDQTSFSDFHVFVRLRAAGGA